MKSDFKFQYDVMHDEWYVTFDEHRLMTVGANYVCELANERAITEGQALRQLFAEVLLDKMENELNGFFVSAVLTKLFNNGMNWSKEVK
jgi:hypothetical protein